MWQEARAQLRIVEVRFKFDWGRTLAAVSYLASKKIPDLTKYKICKLLFLADRLHLVRYGRPITGDTYFAMEWGPVPSNTLNALNDDHPLAVEIRAILTRTKTGRYPRYAIKRGVEMPQAALSKSDLTVLNHIVDEYGEKTFEELYKITHSVPAYYKSWEKREGDRALMRFEDFFEGDPQAINEIRGELLEHAAIEEAILSEAGTDTSLEAGAILRHSAS